MDEHRAMGRVLRLIFIRPLSGLNSNPVVFKAGPFQIVHYGLFAALNTFLTASVLLFYIHAKGHHFRLSYSLVLGCCLAGVIVGVKLFHVMSLGREFFNDVKRYMNQTAMYSQGGIVGMFCSLVILSLIDDVPLTVMLDGAAYGAVLGLAFGRLGCYSYGCCFGRPTSSAYAVTYTHPQSKVVRLAPRLKDTPLIPTQFYCSYVNLVLFVLFTFVARFCPRDGLIILLFTVLYNGFRLVIERYRFRDGGPDFARVAICLCLGLLGFVVLYSAITGQMFVYSPFRHPLSVPAYFGFLFSSPVVLVPVILVTVVSLLFFGVHGRTLGKHIDF